ncbi:MAG TPA: CDF family Co(II)/Ni(II) efflux transporter DmeF [Rhodospirillales bacterium]|nr:CDF family Co(II)/Ni(II) efflux transporter DmeF [Rhodospirillales bacterium]
MHTHSLAPWQHDHAFGQQVRREGERRTLAVTVLTAVMMAVELAAGLAFGSMALLADGLHMASHTAALGLAVVAYVYARRHAEDRRFAFGTGKVNALAGYSSALLLALFAAAMAWESTARLLQPRPIAFDEAIVVAVLGLVVNVVSLLMLRTSPAHPHAADGDRRVPEADDHHDEADGRHRHAHAPAPPSADPTDAPVHDHGHAHAHGHGHDHNLRGAYLHVLADATTSLLAIAALVLGRSVGSTWPDAAVGLVGAVLVCRWAWGLLRDSSGVLLDRQAPEAVHERIRSAVERGDDRVADLHVWSIGPAGWAAAFSVVSHDPQPPEAYKAMIPADARIIHATVEVHRCAAEDAAAG